MREPEMYYRLSECILKGDQLGPRSVGCFYNENGCRCGLGGALLATSWPKDIPFGMEEIESQWVWLTKINPEGNGVGNFGDYLSKAFEDVFWNRMSIEEYAAKARAWEALHDEALTGVELMAEELTN